MKPQNVQKWTQDDIDDVEDALPDGMRFGSLDGGAPGTGLTIVVGKAVNPRMVEQIAGEVQAALAKAGAPADVEKLKAGYAGRNAPELLLSLELRGE